MSSVEPVLCAASHLLVQYFSGNLISFGVSKN